MLSRFRICLTTLMHMIPMLNKGKDFVAPEMKSKRSESLGDIRKTTYFRHNE